jgi:hypothetical protein
MPGNDGLSAVLRSRQQLRQLIARLFGASS